MMHQQRLSEPLWVTWLLNVQRAVGEWRQRPPLAFGLEDILSTCCNKDDVM